MLSKKININKFSNRFCKLCKFTKKPIRFPKQRFSLWFLNKQLPFGLGNRLNFVFKSILDDNLSIIDLKNLKSFSLLLISKLKGCVGGEVMHQYNSDFVNDIESKNKNFDFLKDHLLKGLEAILIKFFEELLVRNSNKLFVYRKYEKKLKNYRNKMYLLYLESDPPGVKFAAISPEGKSSVDLISKSFAKIFTMSDAFLSHMDIVIYFLET